MSHRRKLTLPTFICVGAQRAGTTWLYHCLKEHPEIYMPAHKELRFFNYNYDVGIEEYSKNFEDAIANTRKRLASFLENKKALGNDLLKKIIVYTLMMRKSVAEETFFDRLMKTNWFPETVDLYFAGEYTARYEKVMRDFTSRGIVKAKNGRLFTTVKP